MSTEYATAPDPHVPSPHVVGSPGTTPPSPRKRPGGCFWAALAVAAAGVAAMAMVAFGMAGILNVLRESGLGTSTGFAEMGVDEWPQLREIWSSGRGDTKVIRIPLTGMIFFGDTGWRAGGAGSADMALRSIRRATLDPAVRGILLEVDSGGGGITASDILHKALTDFRKSQPGRHVVTLMGDVAASGGYYVAAASDHIVAHPTTLTGSIGVLIQTINLHDLAERVGIRGITIKSGANKDLLNPLQELPEPQRLLLQNIVDALHQRFLGVVSESRGISLTEAAVLADGRVFLAEEARSVDLIDTVGYYNDAVRILTERLDQTELLIIRYEQEFSFRDLFNRPGLFGMQIQDLLPASETRLLYQWRF